MKTTRAVALLTVTIVYQMIAAAVVGAAEADREADHAALRQLREKAAAGINNLDAKALASCFAKQFAFTAVTQTVITNEAQAQEFFDRMFRSKDALLTSMKTDPTADIRTRFIDENTGVCYGSTTDTYTLRSGETVMMTNRWSATVVKEDGQWKVALAHVGTDFINSPVVARIASFWRGVTVAAGIGGVVLGLVLGLIAARRKGSARA
jgi:ketosteroid isomerase-like protein